MGYVKLFVFLIIVGLFVYKIAAMFEDYFDTRVKCDFCNKKRYATYSLGCFRCGHHQKLNICTGNHDITPCACSKDERILVNINVSSGNPRKLYVS